MMRFGQRPFSWMAIFLSVFFLLVTQPVFAAILRHDGPYDGKVIDAETGEPIKGAVVLGVWSKAYHHVAGSTSTFYDAVETLTDEKGEFHIKGQGLVFYNPITSTSIEPMYISLFKFGYEYFDHWPWESLKVDYVLKKIIKWDGDRAIIPLKKIPSENYNKIDIPSRPESVPVDRMPLLTDEINLFRIKRGLEPYPRGEK